MLFWGVRLVLLVPSVVSLLLWEYFQFFSLFTLFSIRQFLFLDPGAYQVSSSFPVCFWTIAVLILLTFPLPFIPLSHSLGLSLFFILLFLSCIFRSVIG